jgi:hypothetical protein
MDDTKPLINLNGLVISGECFPVTPTPSTTPYEYCYVSATTQTFGQFQCPNNGFIYNDIYGKLTLFATIDGQIVSSHPQLNFIITNGVENQSISILDGQEFTEFVYPRVNFFYTETTCELVSLPDWRVLTPSVTRCLPVTPTNTPTPSITPTNTATPTVTPTNTATPTPTSTQEPICPEQLILSGNPIQPSTLQFNGTYTRSYSYTGGTFNEAYASGATINAVTFFTGAQGGNNYVVYQRYTGGTDYYTIIATARTGFNTDFRVIRTTGDYFFNLGIPLSATTSNLALGNSTNMETFGGFTYPSRGLTVGQLFYISYPEICPTSTPTNTQTPTSTIGTTPTQTSSPTVTPTNTATQTQTPTSTQEPICPEQLELRALFPEAESINGTYNRLYSYTGGTFTYGYLGGFDSPFYPDGLLAGNAYSIYGRQSGSTYYLLIRAGVTVSPEAWRVRVSSDDYVINGGTPISGVTFNTNVGNNIDGIYYPPPGFGASNAYYLSYPEICPTSTPTNTPTGTISSTSTPTPTPTNTQTSTPTGTISSTATPTNTSTPTPTSFTQFGGSGRGNSVGEACSDAISNNRTFYSNCDGLTFGVGCYVYTDSSGTPLTGYTNVFMNLSSWDVNSSTGEITAVSSVQC